jgi:hypothetical protein
MSNELCSNNKINKKIRKKNVFFFWSVNRAIEHPRHRKQMNKYQIILRFVSPLVYPHLEEKKFKQMFINNQDCLPCPARTSIRTINGRPKRFIVSPN